MNGTTEACNDLRWIIDCAPGLGPKLDGGIHIGSRAIPNPFQPGHLNAVRRQGSKTSRNNTSGNLFSRLTLCSVYARYGVNTKIFYGKPREKPRLGVFLCPQCYKSL